MLTEIAVNVLNRDERIEKDAAKFIAKLVFDKLSSNIRECIRIARLADNNITKAQRIADMLTAYSNRGVKTLEIWYKLDIGFTPIFRGFPYPRVMILEA